MPGAVRLPCGEVLHDGVARARITPHCLGPLLLSSAAAGGASAGPSVVVGATSAWYGSPETWASAWSAEALSRRCADAHMWAVVNGRATACRASACAAPPTQLSISEFAAYAAEHAAFDEWPLIVRTPCNALRDKRHDTLLAGEIPLSLPENASLALRVGAERSGALVRSSASVEALVLLAGCLLWLFLPPGTQVEAVPSMAVAFIAANAKRPGAVVLIQEPGETVVTPRGWTYATLKIEPSTSLSISF